MTKAHPTPGATPWLKRLALAVLAPVLVLALLEGALRLAGFGHDTALFIPDAEPGYLRTNPDFASLFLPGTFDLRPLNFRIARHKAPGTLRVFILGESAAQGVPVPAFGFSQVLRAQLRARYPGRTVEVVDTGIVAINSHVVRQIACEVAGLEPDLVVVYMGNNEVVGPYGPGCAYLPDAPPLWLIRAGVAARSTRIGQLAQTLAAHLSRRRPAEWGGMSMFVNAAVSGDDPRLAGVNAAFEENLRAMVGALTSKGVPVVLSTVVANLKDCAPFLSVHANGLDASQQAQWRAVFDAGRLAWRLGDPAAEGLLERARQIDPRYAETSFLLGRIALARGDRERARALFVDALHWDALRFRPDPEINERIRAVASATGAALVDAAREMGSDPQSTEEPCGRPYLLEHVHFDWDGNVRLANLLAPACITALGGSPGGAFLDEAGCARAVGYTPHERLPVLLRIDDIVRKAPFSSQVTYCADQAALARAIARAREVAADPHALAEAASAVQSALAADPDNPALVGILEGIRAEQGDFAAALALAERAQALLPDDPGMAADRAGLLVAMGRVDEAVAAIEPVARSPLHAEVLAPALVEVWSKAGQAQAGLEQIRALAGTHPSRRLRLLEASLENAAGRAADAERDLRSVLREDPANSDALEALVGLLRESGRTDEASALSLEHVMIQPSNQDNDLRAARSWHARGDLASEVRALLAAERSGPVTAAFELTLALNLYKLGRLDEMMDHLAVARGLSDGEGDPSVTASINQLIERMMRERLSQARTASR